MLTLTENGIATDKEIHIDTDSSQNTNLNARQDSVASSRSPRKRVGPYSYKLNDIIGSGFTSTVYRGYKDNDQEHFVAIKVVNLNNIKPHRKKLLENEIRILKKIDHPNTLTFIDVYMTVNNYYIITQYCEGGSLEQTVEKSIDFDWRKAAYQISIACQYLASMNIIHRDIKPSNVLIHKGTYKICDFGFACQFTSSQPIKQDYLIGSPLYMPVESVCDYLYSTKTDSFALGVLLYYISSKKFPWKGKTKSELIENYKKKKYRKSSISHLAPRMKHIINNFLQVDSSKRLPLLACDFEVFLHLGPPHKIQDQILELKEYYSEQLRLCEFINSIRQHCDYFTWANSFLKGFIDRHLSSLILDFDWQNHKAMNSISKKYLLPQDPSRFDSDGYFWLNNCLKETIKMLSGQFDLLATVMLEKLIRYQQIVEAFLFEQPSQILRSIDKLVIHSSFSLVKPDEIFISKSLGKIDYYDL